MTRDVREIQCILKDTNSRLAAKVVRNLGQASRVVLDYAGQQTAQGTSGS